MNHPQGPRPSRSFLRHGTLPQLAAFEAVMRLGSVTGAADALCVAQPTLSGHLRKLADTLGMQLFTLEGRRMVPTAAARLLLQATQQVFEALAECEQQVGQLHRSQHTREHGSSAACAPPYT